MLYTSAKHNKRMSDGAGSLSSVIWHVQFGISKSPFPTPGLEILAYGTKHLWLLAVARNVRAYETYVGI